MSSSAAVSDDIQTQFVPLVLSYMEACGFDPRLIIRAFGLPTPLQRSVRMPLPAVRELTREVANAIQDPYFGLKMGAAQRPATYGVVELAARAASNLGEAVALACRYFSLENDRATLSMSSTRRECLFEHAIPGEPLCAGRHSNEYALAFALTFMRQVTGERIVPERVVFANRRPPSIRDHRQFFGTDAITFDGASNVLHMAPSTYALAVRTSDQELFHALDEHARRRLPSSAGVSLERRVEAALARVLREGPPDLGRLAAELSIGRRTLQRRLAEQGTSFQETIDRVRRKLAHEYLREGALSMAEISFALGYSDLRAFTRAFVRWEGVTPTRFRASGASRSKTAPR